MNNRKIIYGPKSISSEEIKKKQNFENIITGLKKPPSTLWKITGFWGAIGTSIIALLLYNNYFKNHENENSAYEEKITLNEKISADNLPADTECLKTLNKEEDLKFESFFIDPKMAHVLNLEDGSVIKIKENSFITTSDLPVEIKLRVFRNKSEAFIAGVPMDYQDGAFESAGMIEIRGFQGGKPVGIHAEKPIEISLRLHKDPEAFSFYQLDEKTGSWSTYEAKFKEASKNTRQENSTQLINEEIRSNEDRITAITHELESITLPKREDFHLPSEKSRMFNLKFDPYEFPELRSLGNVQFEALPGQKNYNEVINTIWSKMALESISENEYLVKFTHPSGKEESLRVRPVLGGEAFEKALNKFSVALEAKLAKEKELENEMAELKRKNEERQAELLEKIQERDARLVENLKTGYSDENAEIIIASAEFSTTRWGVFNADRPVKYPFPIGQPMRMELAGKQFFPDQIFVFDLKKDVRYEFGNPLHDIKDFGINNNETVIIVRDSGNRLGYLRIDNRSELKDMETKEFTPIRAQDITIEYFKNLLHENRVRA
ncbi:MAG: hypothetical protein R3277_10505 [Brumimicrobium sp.]|nr:hypothetical protein [Brumimicrobium sp.]